MSKGTKMKIVLFFFSILWIITNLLCEGISWIFKKASSPDFGPEVCPRCMIPVGGLNDNVPFPGADIAAGPEYLCCPVCGWQSGQGEGSDAQSC
jgi:hypothetical protein